MWICAILCVICGIEFFSSLFSAQYITGQIYACLWGIMATLFLCAGLIIEKIEKTSKQS